MTGLEKQRGRAAWNWKSESALIGGIRVLVCFWTVEKFGTMNRRSENVFRLATWPAEEEKVQGERNESDQEIIEI